MRLSRRLRAVLYVVVALLFVTGGAWIALDRTVWPETSTLLLRLHGGAAMAMLVILGALLPLHVRVGWRRGKNVPSGLVMLGVSGVLAVTAFGLYYIGSDALRHCTSELHIAIGLGLPLLGVGHVLLGRRARRSGARERSAAQGL